MNKQIIAGMYECPDCHLITSMRDGPCAACLGKRVDASAHHAICPARPIGVGDYVRWTSPMDPRAWAEGTVTRCYTPDPVYDVKLSSIGDWTGRQNDPQIGGTATLARDVIRRIPRPGAGEQAIPFQVGDLVRIVRSTDERLRGAIGTISELAAQMPYRVLLTSACWGAGHAWWCYEVEHVESRGGQHDPAPAAGDPRLKPPERQPEAMVKERYTEPPSPALVDGLTLDECAERWRYNRFAVESNRPAPNVLTPGQIAAGRAAWMAGPGEYRSRALRERIADARARAANPVRVDLQD